MIVPLPLGESDPVRRLQLIAAETAERKHKPRPRTGSGVPLLFQRAFMRGFRHQRLLNTSVTNLLGPPVPLYLAGARLLELVPVVSLMGNLTLVVAVLSYTGQLNLTAVADRDTCPDVKIFAQGVQGTLDELAGSVLGASFMNGSEIPLEAVQTLVPNTPEQATSGCPHRLSVGPANIVRLRVGWAGLQVGAVRAHSLGWREFSSRMQPTRALNEMMSESRLARLSLLGS
jgi:hypothetical protein